MKRPRKSDRRDDLSEEGLAAHAADGLEVARWAMPTMIVETRMGRDPLDERDEPFERNWKRWKKNGCSFAGRRPPSTPSASPTKMGVPCEDFDAVGWTLRAQARGPRAQGKLAGAGEARDLRAWWYPQRGRERTVGSASGSAHAALRRDAAVRRVLIASGRRSAAFCVVTMFAFGRRSSNDRRTSRRGPGSPRPQ
jgi:hypothetical protein